MRANEFITEAWSEKYKRSINCSHPKGFSQKAHCAGKKKHNEGVVMEMTCPDCSMCETHGDHSRHNIDEACWKGYHKEGNKKMFGKTYPNCVKNKKSNEGIEEDNSRIARKPGQPANSKKHSDLYTDENPKGTITGLKFATEADARASVSKIRNSGRSHAHKIQAAVAMEQRAKAAGKSEAAAVYRKYINANKKTDEGVDLEEACWDSYKQVGMKKKSGKMVPNCVPKESVSEEQLEEDLRKWFKEKWVRFGPDGKIRGACARGSESEGKPKCLPQKKAHALGKKKRASAASRKRRQDPNPERQGKAKNVATKSTRDKK
jgi:hypothetical protein